MKRFGLSATERVKKRKDFKQIFNTGSTIYSAGKLFKAVYVIERNSINPGVQIAAAVSKRSGIAFWRNRVKRLLKESFRNNKEILLETCSNKNILLKIIFSPNLLNDKNKKTIKLNDVLPNVVEIMIKLKSVL